MLGSNRKVNMLATSSGAPILPKGCMFLECSKVRSEAVILEANGVSTRPGAMALIRMPLRAYVAALERTSPSTPPLAAAMASWLGSPMLAAAELIRTILPPFVSRRIAARVTENAVVRFRRIVSSYSGWEVMVIGLRRIDPAKQATASNPPILWLAASRVLVVASKSLASRT